MQDRDDSDNGQSWIDDVKHFSTDITGWYHYVPDNEDDGTRDVEAKWKRNADALEILGLRANSLINPSMTIRLETQAVNKENFKLRFVVGGAASGAGQKVPDTDAALQAEIAACKTKVDAVSIPQRTPATGEEKRTQT